MGGGKETPRQKMIGMMYLVLTALLAMNTSKQVLQGYLSVNESLAKSKENLKENNARTAKSFEASINGNAGAKPYYEKAVEAQKAIEETFKYIGQVRANVVVHTEHELSQGNEKIADTLNLRRMEKIDDYDVPSHVLGLGEPKEPEKGPLTAFELRGKLNGLHDKLIAMVEAMQKDPKTKLLDDDYQGIKKKIGSIKPTDSNRDEDGIKFNWEMDNFYHLPLAAVYTSFNKIQNDLKNVEAEILQVFSGASGKLAIKFDHLEAKVIAPSSYIQAGQQYEADIFLAASSSKLGAGDLEVLIGVDSAAAAKGAKGSPIDIENGMGKYSVGTGGQGEQNFNGCIKFKKPDGSYDYYNFKGTYMVAAPATAVEAEKMNVFYIGVDNPIAVSAAGVSPTDLIVNATGGGVSKTGGAGGKFVLKFTTPGECSISVSAKTKDGNKPQGPPKKFRVKKIPDPVAKVGGKTGSVDMKKSELASIGGVGAELAGFEFDAKFIVISFELSAVVKGALKSEPCSGNNLSAGARTILSSAGVGSKIFVENVKAKGPDGTIRSIPGVTIKVK